MNSLIPSNNSILEKIFKYIVIGITIIILISILLSVFKIGIVFWFYDQVYNWVNSNLGFDIHLAKFIAFSLATLLSVLFPYLMWTMIIGRYKFQTAIILISISGIMCISMYTIGKTAYFDPKTGSAKKYYCDTHNGRIFRDSPGYHPTYGCLLKPYTIEIYQHEQRELEKKRLEEKAKIELEEKSKNETEEKIKIETEERNKQENIQKIKSEKISVIKKIDGKNIWVIIIYPETINNNWFGLLYNSIPTGSYWVLCDSNDVIMRFNNDDQKQFKVLEKQVVHIDQSIQFRSTTNNQEKIVIKILPAIKKQ